MYDVAQYVGVSPMTVSRVLSGDAKVSAATRQLVQAAIEKLHYSPNVAARNLAKAATLHIGLLYNNPSANFLNELLVGVLEQGSRAGCQLLIEKCGLRDERKAVQKLLAEGVGGIILPPPLCDSKTVLETLRGARVPYICVAPGRPAAAGLSVGINDHAAAAAMTHCLVSLGHRDIGFIVGAPNQTSSSERYAGYVAALAEHGQQPRPEWVKQGAFTYRSGLLATEQLLSATPRPTAIFASNDDMAAAAIAVAHRFGLEVPRDLTIAGFDDTTVATTIWPGLTTIRQPVAAMARKAIEILVEEIRLQGTGHTLGPQQHIVNFTLIKRESSASR
jgi:LacI family transcriptional regulator